MVIWCYSDIRPWLSRIYKVIDFYHWRGGHARTHRGEIEEYTPVIAKGFAITRARKHPAICNGNGTPSFRAGIVILSWIHSGNSFFEYFMKCAPIIIYSSSYHRHYPYASSFPSLNAGNWNLFSLKWLLVKLVFGSKRFRNRLVHWTCTTYNGMLLFL